jgi:hypothetical protein
MIAERSSGHFLLGSDDLKGATIRGGPARSPGESPVRRGAWKGAAVLASVAVACGVAAGAGLAPSGQPATARATGAGGIAARSVASVALLDLRLVRAPEGRDYRIASALLEVASDLAPDDEEVLRLLIDATSAAGDKDRLLAQTRRLMRMNPEDTVAQLRLISGKLDALQDADQRLAVYERYLGPEGEGIDPSVRSRLALDEALLLRERGDITGFADKLARATELDSTNKDAASLAVTFFTQTKEDAAGRLTLLLNLLLADPMDEATHLAIARELAAGGEYEGAQRFYNILSMLYQAQRQSIPPSVYAEAQTVEWNIGGAERLVSTFRAEMERGRAELLEQRRRAEAAHQPLDKLTAPESLRLTLELERVRAAAASASGDEAQLDFAFGELETTFQSQIEPLEDPSKRAAGVSAEQVQQTLAQLEAELLWMRLWCGRNLEAAAQALERLKADPAVNRAALERMVGWLQLRQGDLDGAQRTLAPLSVEDPLAELGLALLEEKRGLVPDAVVKYTQFWQRMAGTLAGAWARTRVIVLTGGPPAPPAGAAALKDLVAGVPSWIDELASNPRRLCALQASLEETRIGPLRSAGVRLRIRNLAPIPMGIGPDRPLNTRLLLAPSVTLGVEPVGARMAAAVVRMDRRLRLLPQEAVEATVWADAGMLSRFMDDLAGLPAQIRWKVLQGFVITDQGFFSEGPLNLTTDTGMLMRSKSLRCGDDAKGMASWIQSGSSEDVAESLLALRWKLQNKDGTPGALTADEKTLIDQAVAKRWRTLDRSARLMVVALLPPGKQCGWLTELSKAMAEESDPGVLTAALVSRVYDVGDPLLARALSSEDRRLSEVAGLIRARLEAGIKTFSAISDPIGVSMRSGPAPAPPGAAQPPTAPAVPGAPASPGPGAPATPAAPAPAPAVTGPAPVRPPG